MNDLEKKDDKKQEKQTIFTKETLGVVLVLFSTLCLVCLITRDSVFSDPGMWINSFLLGCFGYLSFFGVVALTIFGVLLIAEKKLNINKRAKIFTILSVVTLAFLLNVISMSYSIEDGLPSYGRYLSLSYLNGQGGVIGSTAGGVICSLITYLLTAILSEVGCYVVLSILFIVFTYFAYNAFKKGDNKKSRRTTFNSSYRKVKEEKPPVPVAGEKEYPVANVQMEEVKKESNQGLFVGGNEDFAFKTKKEMTKDSNASGIKIGFEHNGLGVVNYGGSYSKAYSEDLKQKLNYIKTPSVIDVQRAVNESINSMPKVSNPIPNKPIERRATDNAIPCINHDDKKNENKIDEASLHAKEFGSYANREEVSNIKPSKNLEDIPKIDEDELDNSFNSQRNSDKNIENRKVEERQESFEQPKYISPYDNIPEIKENQDEDEDSQELPPVSSIGSRRSREIFNLEDEDIKNSQEETENNQERNAFNGRSREGSPSRRSFGFGSDLVEDTPQEAPQRQPKREAPINREYFRPPLDLLQTYTKSADAPKENHEERMEIIKRTLEDFHINATPESYVQGPSITRYEMKMPAGISVKKVLAYDDDIKMWLSSKHGIRIEAPIPGKNLVGIEVANTCPVTVGLKEILEESAQDKIKEGSLMFAIGKDIVGKPILDNLANGPHYLVAGATGSGKSVCLNIMIVSLIMRYSPEELRLCLIDPKGNEFIPYEHIPHLMVDEIVKEPKKALAVLSWAHDEMEARYKILENAGGIRDINSYNQSRSNKERKMPRIVIIVDELSNLMESCKKEMEARILAIAQKARAVGIHLVLATQRPSVDVITGTIKANLPSRIALKVTNFADSNTILAEGGAEKLLGHGDMLYKNSGMAECERYQGAWISDSEINNVVKYIIEHNEAYFDDDMADYLERATRPQQEESVVSEGTEGDSNNENDEFFLKALWLAVNTGTVSISLLQRRYSIGYARAGGLVDKMERKGFVSKFDGSKARKVLLTREEFESRFGTMPDEY